MLIKQCSLLVVDSPEKNCSWNRARCPNQSTSHADGQSRCGTYGDNQLAVISNQASHDAVVNLAGILRDSKNKRKNSKVMANITTAYFWLTLWVFEYSFKGDGKCMCKTNSNAQYHIFGTLSYFFDHILNFLKTIFYLILAFFSILDLKT